MCAKLEENLGPMGSAVPCQTCAHRISFLRTSSLVKMAKCICHKDFPCPEYYITGSVVDNCMQGRPASLFVPYFPC